MFTLYCLNFCALLFSIYLYIAMCTYVHAFIWSCGVCNSIAVCSCVCVCGAIPLVPSPSSYFCSCPTALCFGCRLVAVSPFLMCAVAPFHWCSHLHLSCVFMLYTAYLCDNPLLMYLSMHSWSCHCLHSFDLCGLCGRNLFIVHICLLWPPSSWHWYLNLRWFWFVDLMGTSSL